MSHFIVQLNDGENWHKDNGTMEEMTAKFEYGGTALRVLLLPPTQ